MRILRAKIYGKVQGISFRKYILDYVKRFGIVGNVKNLYDDTVLIHAKGNNIKEFKKCLKFGPAYSYVDKIELLDFKIGF